MTCDLGNVSVLGTLGKGVSAMMWTIAVVLIILWVLGYLIIHITSAIIHLLLLVALVLLVYNAVVRSRSGE